MFRVGFWNASSKTLEVSSVFYDYKTAFELAISLNSIQSEVYVLETRWNQIIKKMENIFYITKDSVVYVDTINRKNIVYSHKPEDARGMKIRQEFYNSIPVLNQIYQLYGCKDRYFTDEFIHSVGVSQLIKTYLKYLDDPCVMRYKYEISQILNILREFDMLGPDCKTTVKNIFDNTRISELLTLGEEMKKRYGCQDLNQYQEAN